MNLQSLRSLMMLHLAFTALFGNCVAQDSPPVPEDKAVAAASEDSSPAVIEPRAKRAGESQGRKRQSAVAGLLMLGLLCGVFLFLILVVVFWARRIRLETLEPLPEQHSGDPLWYLKNRQLPPTTKQDSGSENVEA